MWREGRRVAASESRRDGAAQAFPGGRTPLTTTRAACSQAGSTAATMAPGLSVVAEHPPEPAQCKAVPSTSPKCWVPDRPDYFGESAAAASGAAAFADIAAASGPHLRAAVEAEGRVGTAPLLDLDQLHGAVRGRRGIGGWRRICL